MLHHPTAESPTATFEVHGTPGRRHPRRRTRRGRRARVGVDVFVHEDRPFLPDRVVHRTTWAGDGRSVAVGARLEMEDPRFAPDQLLVVRYYGEDGQAKRYETKL